MYRKNIIKNQMQLGENTLQEGHYKEFVLKQMCFINFQG